MLKKRAAGAAGQTEKRIPSKRRLDAATPKRAVEVERGGSPSAWRKAIGRLRDSRKPQKILQVPQWDMAGAAGEMRGMGVSGTVKNLSGTWRIYVGRK